MDATTTSTTAVTGAPSFARGTSADERGGAVEGFKPAVFVRHIEHLETIWITKSGPGFGRRAVEGAAKALRAAENAGGMKFLVFDFASGQPDAEMPTDAVKALVIDVANLILRSSVVTVAIARGRIGGQDLELALGCNMLLAEEGATFSFDADPLVSVRTYAFLAQKIGFVRAERLMENGHVLTAADMRELLLVKDILPAGDPAAAEAFLTRSLRRHNASSAIYRAQRIASPIPYDDLPAAIVA
jgi:enoyl-CoA hydratase/carnithine racemase